MSCVIGIDLGGSKIAFGLVNAQNDIISRRRIDTRADEGVEAVQGRIAVQVDSLREDLPAGEALAGIGICTPGPVDHVTGDLHTLVNLPGITNTPFRHLLEARLGIPVALDHDAKVAALGEFHFGAGRERSSMIYIVLGTGVGAAIIYDRALIYGESNSAGESGHMTVNPDGHLCHCGSRGCLETYASGPALERHYTEATGIAGISGAEVTERARAGDEIALRVLEEAGRALGIAVASLAMTLNIELFVVGGSVAGAGDLLLDAARATVPRYSFQAVGEKVRVVASGLGDDAPILGGAWLARARTDQEQTSD